ncbi:MAG: GNAT family N-acetyltransferase [candidate division Zixibacteria bacterium]|nr:GNAT family N-acetyltransferase [candidate division Zixibacteria bacterium]
MAEEEVIIRPLSESDSLEELTELLHRAYRVLADLNLRYMATHQDVNVTRDRIKNGRCFVAEMDGQVVGTITYYEPGHSKGSPWLERPEIAHIGQMGVAPELQGRGIGTRLMNYTERVARGDGAVELALDTAEPATHLIKWYERLGYRFIEHTTWDVTNYRSVIMSKKL